MSWLVDLFCGAYRRRVVELESTVAKLEEARRSLTLSYTDCLAKKSQLIVDCNQDKWYLAARISELTEILGRSIQIPDISAIVASPVTYDPWIKPPPITDHVIADSEYYVYPKQVWIEALTPIQAEVKRVLKLWRPEISDCDNFALVMAGFVTIAFANSDARRQGAFFVAWSRTHAYNVFRDVDGGWWVYEPQNGAVVGKLEECTEKPYDTRKLWALGEEG